MPDDKSWDRRGNFYIPNPQASPTSACPSIWNLRFFLRFDSHNQQRLFDVLRNQNELFFNFLPNIQRCPGLQDSRSPMVGKIGEGNECFEPNHAVLWLEFKNDVVLMDVNDRYGAGHSMADFEL